MASQEGGKRRESVRGKREEREGGERLRETVEVPIEGRRGRRAGGLFFFGGGGSPPGVFR